MAVSLPNGGEINLMMIPEMKYQAKTMIGPYHPTTSANFLEKRMISRHGLVTLR